MTGDRLIVLAEAAARILERAELAELDAAGRVCGPSHSADGVIELDPLGLRAALARAHADRVRVLGALAAELARAASEAREKTTSQLINQARERIKEERPAGDREAFETDEQD